MLWLALLLVLMAAGVAAFAYQFQNGLVVTGMRNIVMWGQYILFFMFFVGLSAGGLIVASAGRLFGVKAFKPITRLAVLEATVAVILAATFILPDLGRPERILNIPLYFNPTSPMIWDITIVMVYMAMSAFYVWLYARADLARRGSWLALGTGTSERTMAREERAKTVMAWIALPAAIMLHSITAWIFGLQIGRGFWYSSIMAPMFIASALVSGMGLVILLALVLRRLGRLVFDNSLVALLGGLLGVFILVEGFLLLAEYLTASYPGAPEGEAAARMLTGPYLPLFLFEVGGRPARAVPDPRHPAAAQRPALGGAGVRHRHRGDLLPPVEPGPQRPLGAEHQAPAGTPDRGGPGAIPRTRSPCTSSTSRRSWSGSS